MIKVRATQLGFYGASRKRPGDEFVINGKSELGKWMEIIDETEDDKPAKAKVKQSVAKKDPAPPVSTGDQEVI